MPGIDLEKLDAMTDADIDYSEIPELPDDFAEQAEWFSRSDMHFTLIRNSSQKLH